MTWNHPTGKSPKTVALVCLGPSRNAYVAAGLEPDLSDAIIGTDEIWTLNRGVTCVPHDLLWIMDHIQGEADKYPRYGARLWHHDRPIITSDNCDGWPEHIHRYPLREIWGWLMDVVRPQHGDWFHNSLAYILVYAAFIGVREIRVFGADYHNHSSGVVEDGHPNVAYWAGRLESAGLAVRVPTDSGFLNANQRGWMYGYRDDPRRINTNRARFRGLTGQPAEESAIALDTGERQVGETIDIIQHDHVARYFWAASEIGDDATPGVILYDVGAGIGYGSAILADAFPNAAITAVDRSRDSLEYGIAHYSRSNIVHVALDLGLQPNILEMSNWALGYAATCFELIEHLADPRPLLCSLRADRLFASVPHEDVVPYSPETAPFHFRHYTRVQFADLLLDCGWTIDGWYGQTGPSSEVHPFQANDRTLIVKARRVA